MNGNILVLDCDGVIFDSLRLIDEYVRDIEYIASDEYKEKFLDPKSAEANASKDQYEDERSNNPNALRQIENLIIEIENLKDVHYEYKDRVLEEADEKYVGRIDYDKIFTINHTFSDVIDMIRMIDFKGLFDKIYVLSHVNCQREIDAKRRFFEEHLPMVEFVPVLFHIEPFYNSDGSKNLDRVRTNKMGYFLQKKEIDDPSSVYFIDDTLSITSEAIELGVTNSYFKAKSGSTINLLFKACFDSMGINNPLSNKKY